MTLRTTASVRTSGSTTWRWRSSSYSAPSIPNGTPSFCRRPWCCTPFTEEPTCCGIPGSTTVVRLRSQHGRAASNFGTHCHCWSHSLASSFSIPKMLGDPRQGSPGTDGDLEDLTDQRLGLLKRRRPGSRRLLHVGIASYLDHDGRDARLPPPERKRYVRAGEGHVPCRAYPPFAASPLDRLHQRLRRVKLVGADADRGPVGVLRQLVAQWPGGERVGIDHETATEALEKAG